MPSGPPADSIPFLMNDGCFLGRQPAAEKARQVERKGREEGGGRRGHLLWSAGNRFKLGPTDMCQGRNRLIQKWFCYWTEPERPDNKTNT